MMDRSSTRQILAIESATDWLSVALLQGEDVLEERRSEARMQHAASLLPSIDATLTAAGATLGDVDAIAISTGPGSFTSLRIGLATVKGLGFRGDLEAVGISTLEAMALCGLEGNARSRSTGDPASATEEVLALLDARRGEWYAGSWRAESRVGALPEAGLAEGLYAPERLADALASTPVTLFAPQATDAWIEALEARGVLIERRIVGEDARPSAIWVGRLGQRRLEAGEGVDTRELRARYLRRAEAEAKLLGAPVEKGEFADLETPSDAPPKSGKSGRQAES